MTGYDRLRSVGGRLLLLVAIIVAPIAVVCVFLATTSYRTTIAGVAEVQAQASSDFAIRTRIWFRASLRTAETTLAALPGAFEQAACEQLAANVLSASPAHMAVLIVADQRPACIAADAPNLTTEELALIEQRQGEAEPMRSWGQPIAGKFRFDIVRAGAASAALVHLRDVPQHPGRRVMVLSKISVLESVFDLGSFEKDAVVGLVRGDGEVFISRGADERDPSWLPAEMPTDGARTHWVANERGGRTGRYTRNLVIDPDIYVLARFTGARERDAFNNLVILAGAPLLMLVLLVFAYWRFVDTDIVKSIEDIEAAAQAEAYGDRSARVAISDGMPTELRRVAEAFNRMAEAASKREDELRASVDHNRFLMRELHHRIKNSLQVIQSHLAITRRQRRQSDNNLLSEAESRVQVLAIAYRYALTERGLQPVPVKQFVGELLANLADISRRTGQMVSSNVNLAASLDIDRAIPLGLAIVEMTFACLRAERCTTVTVDIAATSASAIRMAIAMDGDRETLLISDRTMRGLQMQLGAMVDPLEAGELLRWTVGITVGADPQFAAVG